MRPLIEFWFWYGFWIVDLLIIHRADSRDRSNGELLMTISAMVRYVVVCGGLYSRGFKAGGCSRGR